MAKSKTWASDLEERLAKAFDDCGIRWEEGPSGLDFYLPDFELHVEVKAFHAPRIARQMASAPNVIALQGIDTVGWFIWMLKRGSLK